jgi:hypothetical protein
MSNADVAKLGKALSRPAFRKAFHKDHIAAMQKARVKTTGIPKGVLTTLSHLSENELEALAKVKGALKRARVSTLSTANMV